MLFRPRICEAINVERVWRVWLLLDSLHLPSRVVSKACVQKYWNWLFVAYFPIPFVWHLFQRLQIPWAGTSFLSLFASHNWTLGSETSDQDCSTDTNSNSIFSLSALVCCLHTTLGWMMKINCISFTPFRIFYFWCNIARRAVNIELKIMLTPPCTIFTNYKIGPVGYFLS